MLVPTFVELKGFAACEEFFCVSSAEACYLFDPEEYYIYHGDGCRLWAEQIPLEIVLDRIKNFIKTGLIDNNGPYYEPESEDD